SHLPVEGSTGIETRGEVVDEQILGELWAPGEQRAAGADRAGLAVEDKLVLPADHVHVGEGHVVLPGAATDQALALPALTHVVGRPVDVHDQLSPGGGGGHAG